MEFDQSEPVRARRKRELPTFYYHGHFVELLDFVSSHYGHVLRRQDIAFLETFGEGYAALDAECEALTDSERIMGRYHGIQDRLAHPPR